MCHLLKRFALVLLLLVVGAPLGYSFALLGPGTGFSVAEAYQINTIGYNLTPPASSFANEGNGTDVGTPKNLGQGYRWNLTTIYYAYDSTFANFFGTTGMAAADQAFATFNSLSNVSSYSPGLTEWPQTSSRVNAAAVNLGLLDVKSATMSLIIEQLGLAQPDRWTWALHDRYTSGLTCPNYEYIVEQRNFDPVTHAYSPYVNGTLYGYYIAELCALSPNPYAPLEADAVEYTTDPTTAYSAVASLSYTVGQYYNGLTQDDIGGLRYLYAATNVYADTVESNSFQIFTNQTPQLLVTSNLAVFEAQALTNNGPALEALYPGLIVLTTSNFFTNLVTTNYTATITKPPYAPAGYGVAGYTNTYTTNAELVYTHTYANLEILHYYTNGYQTVQQITYGPVIGGTAGTYATNTNTVTTISSYVNGDFYILPTNACGPDDIIQTLLATNYIITNVISPLTNTVSSISNITFTSVQVLTYTTNYVYAYYPVQCLSGTNTASLRQGVEKINFVRRDYDSLIGSYWDPVTNVYNLTAITNGTVVTQSFTRTVTTPDIRFTVADLTAGPAGPTAISSDARTTPNWNISQVPAGQPGPGTIQPGVVFTFNNIGSVYVNGGPFFKNGGVAYSSDANSAFVFQWGSFDGTTNVPVVYPSSLSLASLEASIYFQITNSLLASASIRTNNPYSGSGVQLGATGGTPPYTWSLTTNSGSLPPGLSLSSTGVISGIPTTTGTYQFGVQATDAGARVTDAFLFIAINP